MKSGTRRRSRHLAGLACALALVGLVTPRAEAAPRLRRQFNLHGDFVMIGNTLGQECRTGAQAAPTPTVGTVSPCGANTADSAYDVFWRSEEPGAGQALASTAITLANARSTAVLGTGARVGAQLPVGASVVHAQLYWAATLLAGPPRPTVTLDRPGVFVATVTAQDSVTVPAGGNVYYQNTANVTSVVRQFGVGAYRVSGFDSQPVVDQTINDAFAAWTLVVVYDRPADPVRNVTLFDGLDFVELGGQAQVSISGFLVPTLGFDAKLGVVAYEGDDGGLGDSLAFKARSAALPTLLGNALNPTTNFFNGTRSVFGLPVSLAGDLPQQTGGARSMSGYDLDIVDISALVQAGDDSATITATSTNDKYAVGALVTSISTLAPDLTTSSKTARAVVSRPSGAILVGDAIEFTLTVTNTGNDDAVGVVLTDVLPAGFTYAPGSIEIVSGPNPGVKTDRKDLDAVDYDDATRTLTAYLGVGADGTKGGTLAPGAETRLRFRATIAAGTGGTILVNQGSVSAAGMHGSPRDTWPTDSGDGGFPEPTPVPVDTCSVDADCAGTRCGRVHPYACEVCNGELGSGASQPCIDAVRPACNTAGPVTGTCTECTAVNVTRCTAPATPTCNTVAGACAGCLVDYGAGASRACPTAALPVCLVGGASAGRCVECASYTQCPGAKPVCAGSACATCTVDFGAAGARPCPTTNQPYCTTAGACAKCGSNADCAGRAGGICNLTTGACGTVCTTDADCPSSEWCAAGSCTPKTPNDQPLPNVAPISGDCTPQNGRRACVSAACFEPDDRCGLPNGEPCGGSDAVCRSAACFQPDQRCGLPKGEPCTKPGTCRSAICATDGRCGECKTDADCGAEASGRVCDDATSLCRAGCRGRGGNRCAGALACTSSTEVIGACVEPSRDGGAPDAADAEAPEQDAAPTPAPTPAPSAAPTAEPEPLLEGGGCACDTSRAGTSSAGALASLALGALLLASRRKRT